MRRQLGHGGLQRQLVGPAGVDPAQQRLDQPVDDGSAHPGRDVAAHRDVLTESASAAATSRRAPGTARARSAGRSPPASAGRSARPSRSPGAAGASGRGSRPTALVVAASSRSGPRPAARARATASGRRSSSDSAPSSTATPARSLTRSLPPTWPVASSTVTRSGAVAAAGLLVQEPGGGQPGDAAADHHDVPHRRAHVGPGVGHGRHLPRP